MTFSWHDFVRLAEWLVSERRDEASERTAISRAYYASYHAASTLVRSRELCAPTQQLTHKLVWQLIRDANLPNSIEAAKLGFSLRNLRESADYRNPFPGNLPVEADRAIATAVAIIAMLQEM